MMSQNTQMSTPVSVTELEAEWNLTYLEVEHVLDYLADAPHDFTPLQLEHNVVLSRQEWRDALQAAERWVCKSIEKRLAPIWVVDQLPEHRDAVQIIAGSWYTASDISTRRLILSEFQSEHRKTDDVILIEGSPARGKVIIPTLNLARVTQIDHECRTLNSAESKLVRELLATLRSLLEDAR